MKGKAKIILLLRTNPNAAKTLRLKMDKSNHLLNRKVIGLGGVIIAVVTCYQTNTLFRLQYFPILN
jgi:hypothetical protein